MEKATRDIFVIMPFTETPTRKASDLTEFFDTNLKARIEADIGLKYSYTVHRSDDSFNITERIIRDLYTADIVLCDLSGHEANPNVMYELGIRLAVTNKPVILFREQSPDNRKIFDIQGFFAYEYNPNQYRKLEEYIIEKIAKFEQEQEVFQSPILRVLKQEPSVVRTMKWDKASNLVQIMRVGVHGTLAMMSVVVQRYLEREHGIIIGKEKDFLLEFVEEKDNLAKLDWSRISFRPRPFPAIEAYLADPIFYDLLEEAAVRDITEYIVEYYNAFFTSESIWEDPEFWWIYNFFQETVLFREALRNLVVSMLTNNDDERTKTLNEALSVLRQSVILLGPKEFSRRLAMDTSNKALDATSEAAPGADSSAHQG